MTTATPVQAAAASDVSHSASGKLASVVIDPAHAVTSKTVLTMQNPDELTADLAASKQEYHVTDAKGQTYFLLKPSTTTSFTSSAGKKHLYDAEGRSLVDLDKKMVSLHGTWLLTRSADGSRIAEVKPSKKIMNVYLNDGDKQPDYTIHGKSKKFTIKDCHRENAVVATLVKGATGFLAGCMKPKTKAEAGKYTLTIQPGVDAAFITALAMICENVKGGKAT